VQWVTHLTRNQSVVSLIWCS